MGLHFFVFTATRFSIVHTDSETRSTAVYVYALNLRYTHAHSTSVTLTAVTFRFDSETFEYGVTENCEYKMRVRFEATRRARATLWS